MSAPVGRVGPVEPARTPGRRAFALLLAAAFLHGLCYLVLMPPWMGEDEPWHLEYAHHVASGHAPFGGIEMSGAGPDKLDDRTMMSLSQLQVRRRIAGVQPEELAATQREILDSMRAHDFWRRVPFAGWGPGSETFDQVARAFTATHQPPTYYLVGAGWLRIFGARSVEAQMWALRALSLLCYLAVVACAYAMGRLVSDDAWVALGCALFVAWLPMHARQAAVVNNDVLAKIVASVALVLGARVLAGRAGWRGALLAAGVGALGLATKSSTAGALAVVVPALAVAFGARLGRFGRAGVAWGAAALFAAAGALYWYGTHNPALPRRLSNLRHRLGQAVSEELRESLWRTFTGAFNWETRGLPSAVYVAVGIGMALALGGALWALARRREGLDRRVLLACAAAVAVQLLLIALRGEGRGRYLFPVLPALGALVAAGWIGILAPGRRAAAVGVLAGLLVAYDAVALWRGLAWNQYGWWGS